MSAGIGNKRPGWRYRHPWEGRSLADLLEQESDPTPRESGASPVTRSQPGHLTEGKRGSPQINEALVASAGIRKLIGKHLTIYTDLPPGQQVDELPQVFDLAVPQWCDYFAVDQAQTGDWQMTGYVIKDKQRFRATGLLPDNLPPFLHGYQRGGEFWVTDQPSAYFRRHLVLHEGTHAFMNTLLGSAGPPWYMEGTAELLGTHLWKDGRLTLRYFPKHKNEVPYWGRVKIIKDDVAQGRAATITQIMSYEPQKYLEVDPYGWSWAAAAFLDGHPQYQKRFRELCKVVNDPHFSDRFQDQLHSEWTEVSEQWQLLVLNLEYGYDIAREAVQYGPGKPLGPGGAEVTITAQRGWQSAGIQLEAGTRYQVTASGRYQVADEPRIWWCEPGGVTLRYHKGRPLGMVLGALRSDQERLDGLTPLAKPAPLGLGRTIRPDQTGTLYLRINDSPAELADNHGTLTVKVMPE